MFQNYPNPFNPTTEIGFYLPVSENVSLVVSNILGQVVSKPIDNENFGRGNHSITFRGYNLASGIYIYTFKAGGLTMSKTMMLLK